MESQLIVRIDPKLKYKASKFAKMENRNLSDVVRNLLEDYVKSRDIGGYIDDLWTRIHKRMESNGIKGSNINDVIAQARKEKKNL